MVAELERLWEKLPFESQWYADNELARHRVDAVRPSRSGGRRPATSSPRSAPRSTSTACCEPTDGSPRCGCAAGSTGSNATRRAAWWSSTSRPARRPVSKDDAQRHAQLAMYQLAIAEGLLPEGDSPGGGRLVYLGKTGAAGADRARAGRADAGRRGRVARAGAARPRRRPQGPQFVARVNDGCAHCPVRPSCPAQAAADGTAHRDTDATAPPNWPPPSGFSRPPTSRRR